MTLDTAVPKPSPRVKPGRKPWKRSPMKRGSKPLAKANRKRKASEFARCYHSRERVRWIKAQPCVYCWMIAPILCVDRPASDNAHVADDGSKGAGRKSGYACIVPLCRNHHRRFDEHRKPFDNPIVRDALAAIAATVQAAWLTR